MAFDPSLIMKLAGIRNTFQKNHPKVVSFVQKELLTELPEGTILELSVTRPGEEKVTTNMKLTAEDLELLRSLKK